MIWRAKVVRVANGRAWVTIPRRAGGRVYGGRAGCDIYVPDQIIDGQPVSPVVAGADVLVVFVEGREADVAIIGVR